MTLIKSRVRRAKFGESERGSSARRMLFMDLIICSLNTVCMRGLSRTGQ